MSVMSRLNKLTVSEVQAKREVQTMNDQLSTSVLQAAKGLEELRANLTQSQADCHRFQSEGATYKAEAEALRIMLDSTRQDLLLQLEKTRQERDFYMRFTVEQSTQMSNIKAMIDDCFERAKQAALHTAPTSTDHPPPAELVQAVGVYVGDGSGPIDKGDAIPRFLSAPQAGAPHS